MGKAPKVKGSKQNNLLNKQASLATSPCSSENLQHLMSKQCICAIHENETLDLHGCQDV